MSNLPDVEQLKLEENHTSAEGNAAAAAPVAEDVVDPWTVTSSSDAGIDYDKLISMCRQCSWNDSYTIQNSLLIQFPLPRRSPQ